MCLVFLLLGLLPTCLSLGPASFSEIPHGLRVSVADEGYDFIAVHYNINSPLSGVTAGQFNFDIRSKQGNQWVEDNMQPEMHAHAGDTVNYWLWAIKGGVPTQSLEQSAIVTGPTQHLPTHKPTTHMTQPPTHMTRPPTHMTQHPTHMTQPTSTHQPSTSVVDTQQGGNAVVGTQTAANTGTANSGGSCTCSGSGSSTPVCHSYPCLIFDDEFNTLDHEVWEHEITAGGGGNWEFQYYTNNRSNSYVRDGVLYVKPTLTSDKYDDAFISNGHLDLWGSSAADMCTGNAFWGCHRDGAGGNIVNPIQSARIRSSRGFNFKYGKVEVEAKMPKGEWLWPAIWMLPTRNAYGQWPASGEIDIVEARGNLNIQDDHGVQQGVGHMGSTLHFGPAYGFDPWETAHAERDSSSGTFADNFHKYGIEWDENSIKCFLDGQEILNVQPDHGGFWKLGNLDKTSFDNPYKGATKMAPFDQDFHIMINLAVGGTAFFPDKFSYSPHPKPWSDKSQTASRDFYNAKSQWYPTWNPTTNNGEDAALKINYVKVWKLKP